MKLPFSQDRDAWIGDYEMEMLSCEGPWIDMREDLMIEPGGQQSLIRTRINHDTIAYPLTDNFGNITNKPTRPAQLITDEEYVKRKVRDEKVRLEAYPVTYLNKLFSITDYAYSRLIAKADKANRNNETSVDCTCDDGSVHTLTVAEFYTLVDGITSLFEEIDSKSMATYTKAEVLNPGFMNVSHDL